MAKTVLFVWECGAGLGHLMQLRPIAAELERRGERVMVATRDVARAGSVFAEDQIALLPALFKLGKPVNPSPLPTTFAHVLYNVGWDDYSSLGGLVDAWRAMFAEKAGRVRFIKLLLSSLALMNFSKNSTASARFSPAHCARASS